MWSLGDELGIIDWMRSSLYIFIFTGKKFLTPKFLLQNQTEKERTIAKPLQLKRKKKNLQMHMQTVELRKNVQQCEGGVCVYLPVTL